MKIYSQNQEQPAILAACPATGHYLEIGAWNAFDKSNVRALYERGWSGVSVEPSPVPFAGLLEVYRDEPRVSLINAAVVLDTTAGAISMYVTADAVSTADPATYAKWKNYAKYDGEVLVPATSLEQIYSDHGPFDFVSIDSEGTSAELLYRLLELGKCPKCICVEHDERTTEILSKVTPMGYACIYVSGENLVLVKQ